MADPLTLLVLVAAGQSADGRTRALVDAMEDMLGRGVRVVVAESAAGLSRREASAAERDAHADALVDVAWTDARHGAATLLTHEVHTGQWRARSFVFRSGDAAVERGRTLGFAAASMLPD